MDFAMVAGQTLGQRVLALRKELGKTQIEMAKIVGVATATWQKIERDEGLPAGETLMQFEKLGINPGWILTGLGPKRLSDTDMGVAQPAEETAPAAAVQTDLKIVERLDIMQEQLTQLLASAPDPIPPRYTRPTPPPSTITFLPFRASAGGGSVVLEDSPGFELGIDELAQQILDIRPKDIRMIEIDGDSMLPTFQSGDIVVADMSYPRRDTLPDDDEIYVISKDGELLVKRAQWAKGGILQWTSDNPAYAPIEVSGPDLNVVRTVGRVLWLWRRAH